MEDFILTPTDKFFEEVRNTLNSVTKFFITQYFPIGHHKTVFLLGGLKYHSSDKSISDIKWNF